MESKPSKLPNTIAFVCACWFLLTGWFWGYLANLVFSFPVAAVGLYFLAKGRKMDPGNKLNKAALIIYIVGLVLSLAFLVVIMVSN